MNIKNFEDIKKIDEELACLFLDSNDAVKWVNTINSGGVKEWIKKNNKQYWEVVRFVSLQRGILGKLRNDKKTRYLPRGVFAQILMKYCPDALDKSDTVQSLKSSMERYKYKEKLYDLSKVLDAHEVRLHIKEVEKLLDQEILTYSEEQEKQPKLEDLLYKYLCHIVEEKNTGFPYSKVIVRPSYDEIAPAISVETFYSEEFLKNKQPSRIDAYEFIDGTLELSKLNELYGKYSDYRNVKLFVVSTNGLRNDVYEKAKEKRIGYVRIDPKKDMTSKNYVLPRSIEDYTKQKYNLEMIEGEQPMSVPMLVMDEFGITSSLSDSLSKHNVKIKKQHQIDVKYIKDEEIEAYADEITKPYVADIIRLLKTLLNAKQYSNFEFLKVAEVSIDPFVCAESVGLSHSLVPLENNLQLGLLDIKNRHAILKSNHLTNNGRFRFTMAHELGHFLLHVKSFEKLGVTSCGDTEETLSDKNARRLEYQANHFASCLLMPKDLIAYLYFILYKDYSIDVYGGKYSYIYYSSKQMETWPLYNNVVGTMSHILDVSIQALEIRLQKLGLLKKDE